MVDDIEKIFYDEDQIAAIKEMKNDWSKIKYIGPACNACEMVTNVAGASKTFKKYNMYADERGQPVHFLPSHIAYISENGYICPGKDLSHICGRGLILKKGKKADQICVKPGHLIFEHTPRNNGRRKCHNKFKKWSKRQRQLKKLDEIAKINDSHIDDFTCEHGSSCFWNMGTKQ